MHQPPLISRSKWQPATFIERGVTVPFTTPLVAMARLRPADGRMPELIVANPAGYDGVAMFHDAHPARKDEGGTQDNKLAITGTTTANIQTDLALALQAMLGFVDEAGEPFHGDGEPLQLLVVCANNLLRNMREALNATIISSTSNVNAGMAALYSSSRITASDWYLFRINGPKPFICQEEQPVMFEAIESGESAAKRRQYEYVVSMAGGVGPGFWQSAVSVGV